MGCSVWSKQNSSSLFEVINVDIKGNERFYGQMEITSDNVIFNRDDSGRQIIWPLCTIKKYGHEFSIFYIQAGRISPSGEGVFAFKTKNAKNLFDAVKQQTESVKNIKRKKKLLSKASSNSSKQSHTKSMSSQNDYEEIELGGSIRRLEEFNNNNNNDSESLFDLNIQPFTEESPEIYMDSYENLEIPYTEVEIAVCSPKPKLSQPSPISPTDAPNYTTIDFVRTMHLSRNMMKSVDNTGRRKTRHDSSDTLSVDK